jgi:hypothetical protein
LKLPYEEHIHLQIANVTSEMGGTCGTHGEEAMHPRFSGWGELKEREHLEDLPIDGIIILK